MKSNRIYIVVIVACLLVIGLILWLNNQKQNDYMVRGKQEYQKHCANCHGEKGEGLRQLIPPLTDTTWISGDSVVCLIKYGIEGEIQVNGKSYSGRMPGNPDIEPDEMADIVSYIREEFNGLHIRLTLKNVNDQLLKCR